MKSRVRARIGVKDAGDVISIPGGRGVKVASTLTETVGVLTGGIVKGISGIVGDALTATVALIGVIATVAEGKIVAPTVLMGVGFNASSAGWHAVIETISDMLTRHIRRTIQRFTAIDQINPG